MCAEAMNGHYRRYAIELSYEQSVDDMCCSCRETYRTVQHGLHHFKALPLINGRFCHCLGIACPLDLNGSHVGEAAYSPWVLTIEMRSAVKRL